MTDNTQESQIQSAQAYEDLHVPALFEQWAERVVNIANIEPGYRVLDVACGTGILARKAIKYTGSLGSVVGVDPAYGMLAVARQIEPAIEWQEGVAESIPFPESNFDSVMSQFGLMFFTDRGQALSEMIRVLKPGCSVTVAVWDKLENSEAYPIEVSLLEKLAGKPAADALRAPFVLGDKTELSSLFKSAGFVSVAINTYRGVARFPSVRTMVEADLRGWLPVMGVELSDELISQILEEAEIALQEYVQENSVVRFNAPAHIITGIKAK